MDCQFLNLDHHIHSSLEKSLIERKLQYIKNRTEISTITFLPRIDPDQFDNKTLQALTFANIEDRILKSYGDAFNVGFDLIDMSNMVNMGLQLDMQDTMANTSNIYRGISNITGYQAADELS